MKEKQSMLSDLDVSETLKLCKIILEKLLVGGLDEQPMSWTENWLRPLAQRMVISDMKSNSGSQ